MSTAGFRLGLGTYDNTVREECIESVRLALETGYRHLDTAQMYGTEAFVGEGLARSSVPREEVTVATKVHPENLRYEDVLRSAEESRERLGVETIDLLYVHWPIGPHYAHGETLPAFDELRDRGVVEHVGLSNYTPAMLAAARDVLDAPVFAHQVEMHPLLQQADLLADALEHGYWLVAYSPLAQGAVFEVPELRAIAEDHGVSVARVSIAWLLSKPGVAPVPKARGEHVRDNYRALDLALDEEDVATIEAIDRERRVLNEEDSLMLQEFGGAPWKR
ncbi:MAG: aldo/keto reductase [Haloarculaceae archaeon]